MIVNAMVGGIEVPVEVPDGSVVTGVVMSVNYQGIEGEDLTQGSSWASSAMPWSTMLGLARIAHIGIEKLVRDQL